MGIYAERYREYIGKVCEIEWVETHESTSPDGKLKKTRETITTQGLVENVFEPKFGRDYLDIKDDRGIYLDSIKTIRPIDE